MPKDQSCHLRKRFRRQAAVPGLAHRLQLRWRRAQVELRGQTERLRRKRTQRYRQRRAQPTGWRLAACSMRWTVPIVQSTEPATTLPKPQLSNMCDVPSCSHLRRADSGLGCAASLYRLDASIRLLVTNGKNNSGAAPAAGIWQSAKASLGHKLIPLKLQAPRFGAWSRNG